MQNPGLCFGPSESESAHSHNPVVIPICTAGLPGCHPFHSRLPRPLPATIFQSSWDSGLLHNLCIHFFFNLVYSKNGSSKPLSALQLLIPVFFSSHSYPLSPCLNSAEIRWACCAHVCFLLGFGLLPPSILFSGPDEVISSLFLRPFFYLCLLTFSYSPLWDLPVRLCGIFLFPSVGSYWSSLSQNHVHCFGEALRFWIQMCRDLLLRRSQHTHTFTCTRSYSLLVCVLFLLFQNPIFPTNGIEQWFIIRAVLPSPPPLFRGHLSMSGNLFGCRNWGRCYWHLEVGRDQGRY